MSGVVTSMGEESIPEGQRAIQLQVLEHELRKAGSRQVAGAGEPDLEVLMRRARHEVGIRDVAGFGFARLLGAMLSLFATVVGRIKENGVEPKRSAGHESRSGQDRGASVNPEHKGDR